jgi:hypothetical protein
MSLAMRFRDITAHARDIQMLSGTLCNTHVTSTILFECDFTRHKHTHTHTHTHTNVISKGTRKGPMKARKQKS